MDGKGIIEKKAEAISYTKKKDVITDSCFAPP